MDTDDRTTLTNELELVRAGRTVNSNYANTIIEWGGIKGVL